jgi:uncharacterized protein (UPF0332 family)/predicted nucleotidyltransferase
MRPIDYSCLKANERKAVEAVLAALRRELGPRLLLAVLIGSKARGDAGPDTDIDLLVVVEAEAAAADHRLAPQTADIDLEHGVLINLLTFSRERWADFAQRQAAFWQNAQRDGMVLARSPRLPDSLVAPGPEAAEGPPDHWPEVRAYLASAWQAVRTAETQFAHARDLQLVANRAYYGIFYAANALLATQGLQRSKHPLVLALFRDRFVRTGEVDASLLRDYELTMKRRHIGEYDLHLGITASGVRAGVMAAQRFVSRVERYLQDHGYPGG